MSGTFNDRFAKATAGHDDSAIAQMSGLNYNTVRDIRGNRIHSIKLDAGLRLCKRLGVSPYWLAGEPEPLYDVRSMDEHGGSYGIFITQIAGDMRPEDGRTFRERIADVLKAAGIKTTIRHALSDRTRPAAQEPSANDLPESLGDQLSALRAEIADLSSQIAESRLEYRARFELVDRQVARAIAEPIPEPEAKPRKKAARS